MENKNLLIIIPSVSLLFIALFGMLYFLSYIEDQKIVGKSSEKIEYPKRIKNIVLMIGDGMGENQKLATEIYARNNGIELVDFESANYKNTITTDNKLGQTTDSAAAGTAIATGKKVDNEILSLDGSKEIDSILDISQDLCKSTGMVTTSYINHATPAAFGSSENSRYNYNTIANDYFIESKPNFIVGGGQEDIDESIALENGFNIYKDYRLFLTTNFDYKKRNLVIFGDGHLPYEFDSKNDLDSPKLSQMSKKVIHTLEDDPDGFFLMIESARIDHAGHSLDTQRMIDELVEFSNTLDMVLEWSKDREDTIIIFTADHETGGVDIISENGIDGYPELKWNTNWHTSREVPLYIWTNNRYIRFGQINDIADIFDFMSDNIFSGGCYDK